MFDNPVSSPWQEQRALNGGFVNISIQTVCKGTMSDPVFTALSDPDLHLSCVIKSSKLISCSWKPHSSAHISFFYNLFDGNVDDDSHPLRECSHYTDSTRTGCDLRVNTYQFTQINVLLNGTADNRTIRNIYQLSALPLRLSPLNWTVKPSREQFHISWTPPEFSNVVWKYFIKYIDCTNTPVIKEIATGLSAELNRIPECSYNISIKGVVEENGGTEWTLDKHYDAVSGLNPMMFAVILIPLLMAALVVLSLIWCMKNKSKIFPKVPQPNPELFKDILNNKINTLDFYITKSEEEHLNHMNLEVDSKLIKSQL
ncbi:uncharacterized protein LOC117386429 [Periophthalmus magnuspinnatus]|uniref:uncharacterized protein LOC117386429 n=1 Tax=Periophthalmus magnuspinnatus TaxID=409849 RepID=UPI00243709C8|nr:uncharacterized protein LOC117386429 [Periophthalmus magnuspinnatus]